MSDGKTHKLVGEGFGAGVAGFRAKQQRNHHYVVEVVGGALGGYVGGQLPDILEPAISSWHRDIAHSCTAGGGILALGNALAAIESACRENAQKCRALLMEQQDDAFVLVPADLISRLLFLFELFWRLAAGFVNGLAAGYLSHLALDAMSPRSIPLLTSAGQRRVAVAQRARLAKR
jgi:LexA-binding, inner membrane-associated putative hydrolase